jgi:hypothetical protein
MGCRLLLLSKNHSSQSLLLPEPIMYCGRNDAQLPNCSAMYFSTTTWPALSFTASCVAIVYLAISQSRKFHTF